MPERPAFCHIIALIDASASTSSRWKWRSPTLQSTLSTSHRKLAHTMRTDWAIQPVARSSRIPASTIEPAPAATRAAARPRPRGRSAGPAVRA